MIRSVAEGRCILPLLVSPVTKFEMSYEPAGVSVLVCSVSKEVNGGVPVVLTNCETVVPDGSPV